MQTSNSQLVEPLLSKVKEAITKIKSEGLPSVDVTPEVRVVLVVDGMSGQNVIAVIEDGEEKYAVVLK